MLFLRQSTSIDVMIGQFVDATDAVTPETAVDLATADLAEIVKHGEQTHTDISAATFTHVSNGYYYLTLSTTHTNTVGQLTVIVTDANVCRPVEKEFIVLPQQVYDSLIGGVDLLDVSVEQIDGDANAADKLEKAVGANTTGTVDTGSTTTAIVASDITEATNDHYNGLVMKFLTGNLAGQATTVTDYNGTTKTFTVTALTEAPSADDTFILV